MATTLRDIGFRLGYDLDQASVSKVEDSINSLKSTATKMLGAIGLTISVTGIASFVKDCVSVASEVEEMENKFNVVFGEMSETVDEWAQNYADAIGRNKNDIKSYLADQQNLLVGFGMTRAEGAKLSEEMTTLALDLASFSNIDEATAVNAMTKAVMGESESAKTLGAVLNDATREQAMLTLGLNGTYESLDQLTKMQVNYQAILSQSPDAIGDCERSLGSYQSTLKQFQAKLKEVKTLIGQFFMPTFQKILSLGTRLLTKLRDGIQRLTEFIDRIGGAERVLKLLAIAAAAIFVALNAKKILSFLKTAGSMLNAGKLKMLAIIAVIVLLVLLVEDFFAFMKGENSLIGEILEKAGVDTDAFRESCKDLWEQVKDIIGAVKEFGRAIGGTLLSAVKQILPLLGKLIAAIMPVLLQLAQQIISAIGRLAQTVLPMILNLVQTLLPFLIQIIEAILPVIISLIETLLPLFMQIIEAVLPVIIQLIETLLPIITQIIETVLPIILELIQAIVPILVQIIETILPVVLELITAILPILQPIIELIGNLVSAIMPVLVSLLEAILPILQPILGVLQPIADILGVIIGAIAKVVGWVSSGLGWIVDLIFGGGGDTSGAEKVNAYAGGTESSSDTFIAGEEGPELVTGQRGKKVFTALETGHIFQAIAMLGKAAKVQPSTVTNTSTSRTVTQYNEFVNTFNGDKAGQQKSAAAMSSASGDAVSEMARALAFAR